MSGLDFNADEEYSSDPKERASQILIEETGLALREAIKRCGVKQVVIAKNLNRAQSHVSLAMTGRQNLTLKSLAELAWASGIEVEVVFKVPSARP
jgi:predicted XRE-type DNA-binding protein